MTINEIIENIDFFCLGFYNALLDKKAFNFNVSYKNYYSTYSINVLKRKNFKNLNHDEKTRFKIVKEYISEDKYFKNFYDFGKEFGENIRSKLTENEKKELKKLDTILATNTYTADKVIKDYFLKNLPNKDFNIVMDNAYNNIVIDMNKKAGINK